MDTANHVQILDEAVCISHGTNTNYTLFRLVSLIFIWQPVKEKENSEFKPVKLRFEMTLCFILLLLESWVNTYIYIFRVMISSDIFSESKRIPKILNRLI